MDGTLSRREFGKKLAVQTSQMRCARGSGQFRSTPETSSFERGLRNVGLSAFYEDTDPPSA
jgi:hypothetical protein